MIKSVIFPARIILVALIFFHLNAKSAEKYEIERNCNFIKFLNTTGKGKVVSNKPLVIRVGRDSNKLIIEWAGTKLDSTGFDSTSQIWFGTTQGGNTKISFNGKYVTVNNGFSGAILLFECK
jgi:hypothetical protein